MTAVLENVRVVEVASYVFAPAAGALLAEWGADVLKIEPPHAPDPLRGLAAWGVPAEVDGISSLWEVSNRGKRGMALDIGTDAGREVLYRLVAEADVFLTNMRGPARAKLGIDVADIAAVNPRIVYTRATGQGVEGPDADRGGYDWMTYWGRSGISGATMDADSGWPAPLPGPAFGDLQSALALAGGVAAALYRRSVSGTGHVVDCSLLAAGMWAIQPLVVAADLVGEGGVTAPRRDGPPNPLVNTYRTADGRALYLGMLQSDRYWPGLCRALGVPELLDDPRFATSVARQENTVELTRRLTEVFEQRTLDQWVPLLRAQEGEWDVVREPSEVRDDPQVRANGYMTPVAYGERSLHLVNGPIRFDGTSGRMERAPAHGEHTDAVLEGLGLSWDEILDLKVRGVVD